MNQETSERVRIFAARTILTMNPAQPQATHVAVRDSTVLAVGGEADMAAWPDAERIDHLRGKVLMPGLIEAHSHLMEGAMWDAVYPVSYTHLTLPTKA